MTKQSSTPTIREVDAEFRGRQIIVSLHSRHIEVRLKGTKQVASLTYEDLVDIALMRQAKQLVGDIPKMKGRR
jgi:hypothetical protein